MRIPLSQRIEEAIFNAARSAIIDGQQMASGGCINDSRLIRLKDGRQYFVKTNPQANSLPGLFRTEALALQRLAAPAVICVPRPIACDDDFIIMQAFEQGRPAPDWQEKMGRQLALLHQATQQSRFGFDCDNYLGTSQQHNGWCNDWLTFWREQRLQRQLQALLNTLSADDILIQQLDRLIAQLDTLLDHVNDPAVLLHGDLWSGNAAANEQGEPVIFDPASYYGHREAETGMMRLFGGFGPACEAAYQEVWPFAEGYERRISLYRLYHELNHLILFGSGYYPACLSTLRQLH